MSNIVRQLADDNERQPSTPPVSIPLTGGISQQAPQVQPDIVQPQPVEPVQLPSPQIEAPQVVEPRRFPTVNFESNTQLFAGPSLAQRAQFRNLQIPQYQPPQNNISQEWLRRSVDANGDDIFDSTGSAFSRTVGGLFNGLGSIVFGDESDANARPMGLLNLPASLANSTARLLNLREPFPNVGMNFGDFGMGTMGGLLYTAGAVTNIPRGIASDIGRAGAATLEALNLDPLDINFSQVDWGQALRSAANTAITIGSLGGLRNTIPNTAAAQRRTADFLRLTGGENPYAYTWRAFVGQDLSPLDTNAEGTPFNPFAMVTEGGIEQLELATGLIFNPNNWTPQRRSEILNQINERSNTSNPFELPLALVADLVLDPTGPLLDSARFLSSRLTRQVNVNPNALAVRNPSSFNPDWEPAININARPVGTRAQTPRMTSVPDVNFTAVGVVPDRQLYESVFAPGLPDGISVEVPAIRGYDTTTALLPSNTVDLGRAEIITDSAIVYSPQVMPSDITSYISRTRVARPIDVVRLDATVRTVPQRSQLVRAYIPGVPVTNNVRLLNAVTEAVPTEQLNRFLSSVSTALGVRPGAVRTVNTSFVPLNPDVLRRHINRNVTQFSEQYLATVNTPGRMVRSYGNTLLLPSGHQQVDAVAQRIQRRVRDPYLRQPTSVQMAEFDTQYPIRNYEFQRMVYQGNRVEMFAAEDQENIWTIDFAVDRKFTREQNDRAMVGGDLARELSAMRRQLRAFTQHPANRGKTFRAEPAFITTEEARTKIKAYAAAGFEPYFRGRPTTVEDFMGIIDSFDDPNLNPDSVPLLEFRFKPEENNYIAELNTDGNRVSMQIPDNSRRVNRDSTYDMYRVRRAYERMYADIGLAPAQINTSYTYITPEGNVLFGNLHDYTTRQVEFDDIPFVESSTNELREYSLRQLFSPDSELSFGAREELQMSIDPRYRSEIERYQQLDNQIEDLSDTVRQLESAVHESNLSQAAFKPVQEGFIARGAGSRAVLYRNADGTISKFIEDAASLPATVRDFQVSQLRTEYDILVELQDLPFVPRVYEWEGNGFRMSEASGKPLAQQYEVGQGGLPGGFTPTLANFPLEDWPTIAQEVRRVMMELAAADWDHGDFHAGNIFWDTDSQTLTLIDFGQASRMSDFISDADELAEFLAEEFPESVEGVLDDMWTEIQSTEPYRRQLESEVDYYAYVKPTVPTQTYEPNTKVQQLLADYSNNYTQMLTEYIDDEDMSDHILDLGLFDVFENAVNQVNRNGFGAGRDYLKAALERELLPQPSNITANLYNAHPTDATTAKKLISQVTADLEQKLQTAANSLEQAMQEIDTLGMSMPQRRQPSFSNSRIENELTGPMDPCL